MSQLRRELRAEAPADAAELERLRPKTRRDCIAGERPCPWVGCRWNLFLDVKPATGSVMFNFPGKEPADLVETCALDISDRGGATLDRVADLLGLTKERVRQIETAAVSKLAAGMDRRIA